MPTSRSERFGGSEACSTRPAPSFGFEADALYDKAAELMVKHRIDAALLAASRSPARRNPVVERPAPRRAWVAWALPRRRPCWSSPRPPSSGSSRPADRVVRSFQAAVAALALLLALPALA